MRMHIPLEARGGDGGTTNSDRRDAGALLRRAARGRLHRRPQAPRRLHDGASPPAQMAVGWTGGDDGGRGQGAAGPPVLTAGRAQVGGKCVMPYPGNAWQHPKIHQSPDCLHLGGWHDVAGALPPPPAAPALPCSSLSRPLNQARAGALSLPEKGEHHVFQGCPASQGWSHSFSKVRCRLGLARADSR